jgi:hypothetical protein
MRTDENSKFALHKTATRDWYAADEVDARLKSLVDNVADIFSSYTFGHGMKKIYIATEAIVSDKRICDSDVEVYIIDNEEDSA